MNYAIEISEEELKHLIHRREQQVAAAAAEKRVAVMAAMQEIEDTMRMAAASLHGEEARRKGNPDKKAGESPSVKEQLGRFVNPTPGEGIKYDMGKPPLDLINRRALEAEAQVMAYGATKYGRDNWRGGMDWSRLIAATLRHVTAFGDGEDNDQETGLSHLAHARCCLAFLIQYQVTCRDRDDRHGRSQQKAKSL